MSNEQSYRAPRRRGPGGPMGGGMMPGEKAKDFNQKIVPAELIIAKHRKGGLGTVNLLFELNMSSFKSQLKAAGDENE